MELPWVDRLNPVFPPPGSALTDPDGLLAVGGNLSPDTLLKAYRQGIFPWFDSSQPILWWSPSQRAVLFPGEAHVSRSLRRTLRREPFAIATNTVFDSVITSCAEPRAKSPDTWITPAMAAAYSSLHRQGLAHSVECWLDGDLVGGLYGVQVGGVFCGESMFSRVRDASKAVFAVLSGTLADAGFDLIDCQLENPHLSSLGTVTINRERFLQILENSADKRLHWPSSQQFDKALDRLKGDHR